MFIAMNRFRVKKGSEEALEKVWLSRDSQLAKVPGFVEFRLLKGPARPRSPSSNGQTASVLIRSQRLLRPAGELGRSRNESRIGTLCWAISRASLRIIRMGPHRFPFDDGLAPAHAGFCRTRPLSSWSRDPNPPETASRSAG